MATTAPATTPPREAVVTARASARVLPAATVRQGRPPQATGPHVQLRTAADGTVLIEFN